MVQNPASFQQIGGKFHLNITSEMWGSWLIDASASGPSCTEAAIQTSEASADVTITIAAVDFNHVMQDISANYMSTFFAGKIMCSGNQMLATRSFPKLLTLVSA